MSEIQTLGDALPLEIQRVQHIREVYLETGPAGHLAALMMKASIDNAIKASISGDVVEMLRAYEDLKGYEL